MEGKRPERAAFFINTCMPDQPYGPRRPLQGGGYRDNGLPDRPDLGIHNPALVWPGESTGSQSGPNTSQRGGPGVGSSGTRGVNQPMRGGSTGLSQSGVNRPMRGGSTGLSQSGVNRPVAGGTVGGANSPQPNLQELGIGPNFDSYTRPEGATIMEGQIGSGLFMAGEGASPRDQALAIAEEMIEWNEGLSVDSKEELKDRTVTRSGSTARNGIETSTSGSMGTRSSMSNRINTSAGGSLTQSQHEALQRTTGYNLPYMDRHGNPIRYEFEHDHTDSMNESRGSVTRGGMSVRGGVAGSVSTTRGGAYMVREGIDPNTGLPYHVREPLRTTSSHQLEGSMSLGGRHFRLPQIPGLTHRWDVEDHHPERLPNTRTAPSMPSRAQMLQHGDVAPTAGSPDAFRRGDAGGYWLP